jgi:hypothetical protein
VAGEPPQIQLGWPQIGDVVGLETGDAAVWFGDLLVTGLQQTAVECRSTTNGSVV